ncbi:MAG: response regulator [Candidatus Rokubacteria bacterium]|nr:response regulator [Candidatus Rokubacteria bacterium]
MSYGAARLEALLADNESLRRELEQALAERQQLEDQLRRQQRLEAMAQLASGVAHDFNNLLTVITGYTELLLKRLAATDPLRGNAESIKKAAEWGAALTQRLLASTRKPASTSAVVDLNAAVADIAGILGRAVGEHIELTTTLDPGVRRVGIGPAEVEQVLVNLVLNARDAMPRGGRLTIRTANALESSAGLDGSGSRPARYAILAVSDTGCGMDADTRTRLFEPGFTTKAPGKGSGLGLATVASIVRQSGGFITVKSEPGRGSTFTLCLPRADDRTEPARSDGAGVPPSAGAETVLVVDDQAEVRELIRDVLELHWYTVLEARQGDEALALGGRRDPIDLLITDVVMPGMSGQELARRLTSSHPVLKVLYISGHGDDALDEQGVRQAESVLLRKPFSVDSLARKVREVLGPAGRPRTGASGPPASGPTR